MPSKIQMKMKITKMMKMQQLMTVVFLVFTPAFAVCATLMCGYDGSATAFGH